MYHKNESREGHVYHKNESQEDHVYHQSETQITSLFASILVKPARQNPRKLRASFRSVSLPTSSLTYPNTKASETDESDACLSGSSVGVSVTQGTALYQELKRGPNLESGHPLVDSIYMGKYCLSKHV